MNEILRETYHRLKILIGNKKKNRDSFIKDDSGWIEQMKKANPAVISIMHPDWRGIRSSTLHLFPDHYFVGDDITRRDACHIAEVLKETGCKKFLFSGFANGHALVLNEINRVCPDAKIFLLWHANFLQSSEHYVWNSFKKILNLHLQGKIHKLGFVKKGMAEVLARRGYRTGFVMNYVPLQTDAPSTPLAGGPHLGIWYIEENWRKQPYAMIAASSMLDGAVLHMAKISARSRDFIDTLGLKVVATDRVVPQADMPGLISKMHVNLYVTLSECAPMLPLESLSVGTPCLVGPTSHLFSDDAYLASRLIVPYPDSAQVIARYIDQALQDREQIISVYKEYSQRYVEKARKSALEFLEH